MNEKKNKEKRPVDMTLKQIEREVRSVGGRLSVRGGFVEACRIGELLFEAKKRLGHGRYGPWLKSVGVHRRNAQIYVKVAASPLWHQWSRNANPNSHLPPFTLADGLQVIRDGERNQRKSKRVMDAVAGHGLPNEPDFRIEEGDFRQVRIDPESVDCCVYDPPWDKPSVPLYGAAAEVAARILKPGGLALVYLPHSSLPEALSLSVPHLQWLWPLCLTISGNMTAYAHGRLKIRHRTIGLFSKGNPRPHSGRWIYDHYHMKDFDPNGKAVHDWAQSFKGLAIFLARLTRVGDMIADLTLGSGTTACVVKALGGRSFVGCDIDRIAIARVRKRLAEIELGSFRDEGEETPGEAERSAILPFHGR
jgi:hypothetical protein